MISGEYVARRRSLRSLVVHLHRSSFQSLEHSSSPPPSSPLFGFGLVFSRTHGVPEVCDTVTGLDTQSPAKQAEERNAKKQGTVHKSWAKIDRSIGAPLPHQPHAASRPGLRLRMLRPSPPQVSSSVRIQPVTRSPIFLSLSLSPPSSLILFFRFLPVTFRRKIRASESSIGLAAWFRFFL